MPTNATADRETAELRRFHDPEQATRRLYITTLLADKLMADLEELGFALKDGPLDRDRLRGQLDDILTLGFAMYDELKEIELD